MAARHGGGESPAVNRSDRVPGCSCKKGSDTARLSPGMELARPEPSRHVLVLPEMWKTCKVEARDALVLVAHTKSLRDC